MAEITAEIERWSYVGSEVVIACRVELLAELPTGFPGDALSVAQSAFAEDARAVRLAEAGETVAEGPAFVEGLAEDDDLVC